MPTLEFESKAFVYSHHLSVPHRELIPIGDKGVGSPDLNGNLIVQRQSGGPKGAVAALRGQGVRHLHRPPPYNTGTHRLGRCGSAGRSGSPGPFSEILGALEALDVTVFRGQP